MAFNMWGQSLIPITDVCIMVPKVMQSGEISLKSNMWHFQFSIWLKCSFEEVYFTKTQLNRTSASNVMSKLKDSQNKRNSFLFWLYLIINAPNFRLIPLDHNTWLILLDQVACKEFNELQHMYCNWSILLTSTSAVMLNMKANRFSMSVSFLFSTCASLKTRSLQTQNVPCFFMWHSHHNRHAEVNEA